MKKLVFALIFSMLYAQEIRFNRIYVKNKIVAETLQVKEILPKQVQDSVSFRKVLIWDKLIAKGTERKSIALFKDITFALPFANIIGSGDFPGIWQTPSGEPREANLGTLLLSRSLRLVYYPYQTVTEGKWDTIPNFRDIRRFASGINVRIASTTVNLTDHDAIFQWIRPDVQSLEVILPTSFVRLGKRFVIKNDADIITDRVLVVKQGSNYIDVIYPQGIKEFVWDGYNWRSADITGLENIAIGSNAGSYDYGIAIGPGSFAKTFGVSIGYSSYTSNSGVTIGPNSGVSLDLSGVGNIIIGAAAGGMLTTGTNNIIIGREAGSDPNFSPSTGSYNVLIGYHAWTPSTNTSNFLNIGGLIFGTNLATDYNQVSTGNLGIGIASPSNKLDVNGTFRSRGSIHLPTRTITSNYTAGDNDFAILVDASASGVTVTLPVVQGRVYSVKKIAGLNDVTVVPSSGTIDGSASITLSSVNSSILAICDGTNYYIIAQK